MPVFSHTMLSSIRESDMTARQIETMGITSGIFMFGMFIIFVVTFFISVLADIPSLMVLAAFFLAGGTISGLFCVLCMVAHVKKGY